MRASRRSNQLRRQRKKKHMSYNNGQKLSVKVAVITGGSPGIGAAIAKRLPTDGASVVITYTKGADAAALVIKEIEGAGGKAITIQPDAGLIAIEAFQPGGMHQPVEDDCCLNGLASPRLPAKFSQKST